jgi:hypothetical protein
MEHEKHPKRKKKGFFGEEETLKSGSATADEFSSKSVDEAHGDVKKIDMGSPPGGRKVYGAPDREK